MLLHEINVVHNLILEEEGEVYDPGPGHFTPGFVRLVSNQHSLRDPQPAKEVKHGQSPIGTRIRK